MKPRLLILLFATHLMNGLIYGQLEPNAWSNFEGRLGNSDFQISLYKSRNGEVKGNYILKYTGTKIPLAGTEKGAEIFLRETTKDTSVRTFKGRVFKDTTQKFSGMWADSNKDQSLLFSAGLIAVNHSSFDHRYADLLGTTEEVEGFVKKAVTAILGNDKEWVAAHTRYPQKHLSGKGFTSITSKQQLIRNFEQVFTKTLKDKIRQDYYCNLFVKNGAVMLGSGELWIGNLPNSTKDKYGYDISAINP